MQKQLIFATIFLSIFGNFKAQMAVTEIESLKNKPSSLPILIEEVKKTGNEIIIPYKRYQLPNGLTILIHEDHSDPICYVDVTYHVGSAREQQGRSGFAHFFEHMMFQGSSMLQMSNILKLLQKQAVL